MLYCVAWVNISKSEDRWPGRFVLFSLSTHVHSVNDCTWCFSTFFLFFSWLFFLFFLLFLYCFLYFLGVSLELREGPERHVFRSLRGRHSKGKGKGIEGARPRAREEGNLSFLPRAPKFPLLLPLLTPATQAMYFEYRSPHVRNSGFRNLETFTGGIRNPKNFCCGTRTPDSRALESVIQRKESGI